MAHHSEPADERIARIRAEIARGTYPTAANLEAAMLRLCELLSELQTAPQNQPQLFNELAGELLQHPPGDVTSLINSIRLSRDLVRQIDACPVGDGNEFREFVLRFLSTMLGPVVDRSFVRGEFPLIGGSGDGELTLCTERLSQYPLWQEWSRRYDIRCVMLEAKNLKRRAQPIAISQTLGNLVSGGRGRFGLLVSRNGFTNCALARLSLLARQGQFLILPLDQKALRDWSDSQSPMQSMQFLRRIESELLRAA